MDRRTEYPPLRPDVPEAVLAKPHRTSQAAAQAALRHDDVTFRRLDCRWYDRCLGFSAEKGWESFTCRLCPVDDRLGKPERDVRDAAVAKALEKDGDLKRIASDLSDLAGEGGFES